MKDNQTATILVVDDVPYNIDLLAGILRPDYRVQCATNGVDALRLAHNRPGPSLILLDVLLPGMSGHEVCRRLKADLRTRDIPVIFVTATTDSQDEELGLQLGAVDYLHKPCAPAIVKQRVRIHLDLRNQSLVLEDKVRERTRQLEETRLEIVRRLGRAAEYRDNETGLHVVRMSAIARLMALAAGVSETRADLLLHAAPMHDIGKIGIPDHILLKPTGLVAAEWSIMKTHPLIGAEIIGHHDSDLLQMARIVALTHHEKWNGKGYPYGLSGETIPIEGRIVTIADVYDALTSERPYKRAWTPQQAIAYIEAETGVSFDPELVRVFKELMPSILQIGLQFADRSVENNGAISAGLAAEECLRASAAGTLAPERKSAHRSRLMSHRLRHFPGSIGLFPGA